MTPPRQSQGWIEELPVGWSAGRLRWLARRFAGGTPNKDNEDYWTDGTIPWLNSGAVNQFTITEPSAFITEQALQNSSARWIPEGALVMALAGQGKTKGMVAQLAIPTTCNQSMAAIVPTEELNPRYLLWWLTSNYQNIRNMAGGDDRDGLNLELLGNIECPLPAITRQAAIAAFLDRETGKIDALVEEQRRLIELLKEKRQAVISHAVTKGLDPNAKMKPSGVEWLGDVPEHWDVAKLGRRWRLQGGYAFASSDFGSEGIPVVRMNNLNRGRLDLDEATRVPPAVCNDRFALRAGDLVWGMSGSVGETGSLGNYARVLDEELPLQLNQRVGRFVEVGAADNADYLEVLLQSHPFYQQVLVCVTGTAQFNISSEQVQSIIVAFPPAHEMREIARSVTSTLGKYDALMQEAETAICFLRERRSALISATVTGKINPQRAPGSEGEAA